MSFSLAASWRRLALAGAAVTAAGIPAGLAPASPAGAAPAVRVDIPAVGAVVHDLEADRAWVHYGGLQVDPALSQVALRHSIAMAEAGRLYDTANLSSVGAAVPGWSALGENVGKGPSTGEVAFAFVHSMPHLAIILGRYNLVGVGVVASGGQLWVTEDFADDQG